MVDKNKINDLISAQEGWVNELNDTLEKLKKYRDGKLPFNENQINNISNAQSQLAQAVKNRADVIKANLVKNK